MWGHPLRLHRAPGTHRGAPLTAFTRRRAFYPVLTGPPTSCPPRVFTTPPLSRFNISFYGAGRVPAGSKDCVLGGRSGTKKRPDAGTQCGPVRGSHHHGG